MNKLTKVGLSALCGSLAAASAANAGELAVTGGATATYVSNEGTVTGNPIGLSSGILLTGTGELDNGTTFTLTLSQTDQSAYSVGSITLVTPSMGQIKISQATGGVGIDVKDDAMPTAWEETDGAGLTIGHDKISGVGGSMAIEWKSAEIAGSTVSVTYAPANDGTQVNDKASSGTTSHKQVGWDVLLDINSANAGYLPNIFAGYSITDVGDDAAALGTKTEARTDVEEAVVGAIFKIGPISAGAQVSGEWLGNEMTASDVAGYKNIAYGVSFNISDDLSISYGNHESKKGFVSSDTGSGHTQVRSEAESMQLAYTLGGASFKIAKTEVENAEYVTGTGADREGTTVALSLAF